MLPPAAREPIEMPPAGPRAPAPGTPARHRVPRVASAGAGLPEPVASAQVLGSTELLPPPLGSWTQPSLSPHLGLRPIDTRSLHSLQMPFCTPQEHLLVPHTRRRLPAHHEPPPALEPRLGRAEAPLGSGQQGRPGWWAGGVASRVLLGTCPRKHRAVGGVPWQEADQPGTATSGAGLHSPGPPASPGTASDFTVSSCK